VLSTSVLTCVLCAHMVLKGQNRCIKNMGEHQCACSCPVHPHSVEVREIRTQITCEYQCNVFRLRINVGIT